MLNDTQQIERQSAITRILRDGHVRRQEDLVRLLKKEGHDVTQSSVSRDLRDLGVSKAAGRYVLPADEAIRTNGAWRGLWLAASRVGSCHPWGTSGYDPVPDVRSVRHPFAPWRFGKCRQAHRRAQD